jgi:hypothetical protein
VPLFSPEWARALVFFSPEWARALVFFSPEWARALVFFSPEWAQALVFSFGSAKVAEHAGAGLQAERLAERVLFGERGATPERAGAGLRAERVPGGPPYSLGQEET